jgi:hypothetical protein
MHGIGSIHLYRGLWIVLSHQFILPIFCKYWTAFLERPTQLLKAKASQSYSLEFLVPNGTIQ